MVPRSNSRQSLRLLSRHTARPAPARCRWRYQRVRKTHTRRLAWSEHVQAAQTCAAGQLQLLTCQDACRPRSLNSPDFRSELETLATRTHLQPCSQPRLPHGERGMCCWTQHGSFKLPACFWRRLDTARTAVVHEEKVPASYAESCGFAATDSLGLACKHVILQRQISCETPLAPWCCKASPTSS